MSGRSNKSHPAIESAASPLEPAAARRLEVRRIDGKSEGARPLETSERLVQQAQRKDADAFGILVARFERTALALAYSATGNSAIASDVVQDAFLRAWQRIDELNDPSRFGGWFCRIVRNLALDAIRRGPRFAESLDENRFVAARSRHDDDCEPTGDLVREETGRRVANALQTLDEVTRSAVVLRYYEDLSSKQIAEMLELSPAAVDMRLSRARSQLREILSWADESAEQAVTNSGHAGAG